MRRRASFSTRCKWRLVTICFKGGEGVEAEEAVKLKTKLTQRASRFVHWLRNFACRETITRDLKRETDLQLDTEMLAACPLNSRPFKSGSEGAWHIKAAAAAQHVNCRGTSLSGAAYPSTAEATFVFRLVFSRSFSRNRSCSLCFALSRSLSCSLVGCCFQSVNYSMSIVEKLQIKFNWRISLRVEPGKQHGELQQSVDSGPMGEQWGSNGSSAELSTTVYNSFYGISCHCLLSFGTSRK